MRPELYGALRQLEELDAQLARVIGPSADIGAFELDTTDVIFADGFD
jgi:hypothetical protein